MITGQLTGQLLGEPPEYHVWHQLRSNPTLDELIAQEFDYVLIDSRRWDDLSPESQQEFEPACIEVFAEVWDNSRVNFRRILDLRPCYP